MSTLDPIPPKEGFEIQWLLDGVRLLGRTPFFFLALVALPFLLGHAMLYILPLFSHTPTLEALFFALTTAAGAACFAPLTWLLFQGDSTPLPLSWAFDATLSWALVAGTWALAVALPITLLSLLAQDPNSALLPSLFLPDPSASALTIGTTALTKGILALLVVGPYSLGFAMPNSGSLPFGAFFSKRTKIKAPNVSLLGTFLLACLLLCSVFNPLAALAGLALLLPWLHIGAKSLLGGRGTPLPQAKSLLSKTA